METKKILRSFVSFIFAAAFATCAIAQGGKIEFHKIAEGVFAAVPNDVLATAVVNGNSLVIINETDVVVVDSNIFPSQARTVLAEIRRLTNKPVRYVVNTHHHSDHIYGNQVYAEAFPGVEFIAHANMREDFEKLVPSGFKEFLASTKKTLETGPLMLQSGKKENGTEMTEPERASLTRRLELFRNIMPDLEEIRPTGPGVTMEKELRLFRSGREIRIMHLGRGHTRGDLVVYLPKEKILATGDLLVLPVPFATESQELLPWVETVKRLKELDVLTIIPGHGPIQKDAQYADLVIAMFESVLKQVDAAVSKGLSLEETQKAVDLEVFRTKLTGNDAVKDRAFRGYFARPAIASTYQLLKSKQTPK